MDLQELSNTTILHTVVATQYRGSYVYQYAAGKNGGMLWVYQNILDSSVFSVTQDNLDVPKGVLAATQQL